MSVSGWSSSSPVMSRFCEHDVLGDSEGIQVMSQQWHPPASGRWELAVNNPHLLDDLLLDLEVGVGKVPQDLCLAVDEVDDRLGR